MAAARTIQAEAPIADFALSPSGSEIAAVLKNGKIQVWSVAGAPLRSWPASVPPVEGLLYAGDNHIVTGATGTLTVLEAATGARLASWSAADVQGVFAPASGELIAVVLGDGTVGLWKLEGTAVRTLRAPGLTEITRVALSRGGERIAACGTDADVRLFDGKTGAVAHVVDLAMTSFALDFSPDGRTLAVGSVDGRITLWDAQTGGAKTELPRYPVGVGAVAFSPDGVRLASTSVSINPATSEAEARVYDLASRKETSLPLGVSKWNAIGFAPDGRPFVVDIRAETISIRDLTS